MNSYNRLKIKRRRKILLIIVAAIAVFAIVASMFMFVYNKNVDTVREYSELLTLVAEEKYSEAYDKANSIIGSNYEDTTAILYLCSSHMLYEQGDVSGAYDEISKVAFRYIEGDQLVKIEEYKEMLRAECEKIIAEEGVTSEESEKVSNRTERETRRIKTEVKTAEEEFAYTDAEEMQEESEQTNNNKRAERENENGNENS